MINLCGSSRFEDASNPFFHVVGCYPRDRTFQGSRHRAANLDSTSLSPQNILEEKVEVLRNMFINFWSQLSDILIHQDLRHLPR
jgi:hypothetical protein